MFWNCAKSTSYYSIFKMACKPKPVIQIAYMILGKVILILVAMQLGVLQFLSVIILVMFVLR